MKPAALIAGAVALAVLFALAYGDRTASAPSVPDAALVQLPAASAPETFAQTSPPPVWTPPEQVVGYSDRTYKGYACTIDCSGHEAGYAWAEEHDIDEPDDCGGNSNSFIVGCQAYVEEQQAAMSDREEESEDDQ